MTRCVNDSAVGLTAAAVLSCAALIAAPAHADQGLYLGAIGGITLDPDANVRFVDQDGNTETDRASFETSPAGSVVAGYTFASGLRPELELGYRRANVENSVAKTSTSLATGSLYYNVSRKGYFFYIGGGGGYADVRLDAGAVGKDDDGAAVYSLGTGFGLPAGRQLMVGVDYRYVGAFERTRYDYDVDGVALSGSFRYRSHFVGLSLRYSFGSALADSHPVQPVSEPSQVVPVNH